MAQNPYVNKVIYGNQTVMDISDSTAEAADVAAGEVFYKADGSRTVGTYVPITPASVTPSNVSPAALTANTPVTPTANGYAIESYASVTPSSAGTYFQSGICNMTTSGYAYDSQQGETETTLWENPSPTSAFYGGALSLSGNWTNYSKIVFYYKSRINSSDSNAAIYRTSDITNWSSNYYASGCTGSIMAAYDTYGWLRAILANGYLGTDSFYIEMFAYSMTSTDTSSNYCILTKITGIN